MPVNRKYVSAPEKAKEWNISPRRVQTYLQQGRIPGAYKIGRTWIVPASAQRPKDNRFKKQPDMAKPLKEKDQPHDTDAPDKMKTDRLEINQADIPENNDPEPESQITEAPDDTGDLPEPEPPKTKPIYHWRQEISGKTS